MTNDEIRAAHRKEFEKEVLRVEKYLKINRTATEKHIDEVHQAMRIRDILIWKSIDHSSEETKTKRKGLVPNPIRTPNLTQQAEGVTITSEEKEMIQANKLEYSFQLHLKMLQNIIETSLLHIVVE